MALTSFGFFSFFILSLFVYYLIPQKMRWVVLVAFSAVFFCLSGTAYTLIYLVACILGTALCAMAVGKLRDTNKKAAAFALTFGIVLNIGMLSALKYNGFLVNNVNHLARILHIPLHLSAITSIAPIGISFYTFTAIGYLIDVYTGIAEPQRNIGKVALFLGYWPQLTSGPITRYGQVCSMLFEGHSFDFDTVTFGIWRMLWGVFKKLVISARLGVVVDTIYNNTATYDGLYVWLAAGLFMIQLYSDFSGCMDIIIGASECYGIPLPENFRTPFCSRSVQEFWQRWHITLGSWMRDYILYPILHSELWHEMTAWIKVHWGRRASKLVPNIMGMLVVWLMIGLWHGGAWKYILGEGVWFWLCIAFAQVFSPVLRKLVSFLKINTECFSYRLFQSLRVFVLVSIGNMFFRLGSFRGTLAVIRAGLHWNPKIFEEGSLLSLGLSSREFCAMLIGLAMLAAVSYLQEKKNGARKWLANQNILFQGIVIIAIVLLIYFIGMYGTYSEQDFMYQQF